MRKTTAICAVLVGALGLLFCIAAVGLGWTAATRTADRVDRAAVRLDAGMTETDERIGRVESRVSTLRSEINEIRGSAEGILADNPELPRVRAQIERLLEKLLPALDRLDATAESLRSVAAGLRAVSDIVDQLHDDPKTTVRIRSAADGIDRAAEKFNSPRARVDAVKSAKAVQLTQKLVELAREAVAGADLLVEGLVTARQQIAVARVRVVEYGEALVFRVYVAAVANTLFWLWGGLGQLCLIGWGRRRLRRHPASPLTPA
jgi:hypothetical protein